MDNNKLNFITTYLRHRSPYTAYCIAYNVEDESQYESIMAAAHQLMDGSEVGGLIRSVLEHVHYEVEQEIRAQQKTELLTIQRKRELLANIATGEMYAIQNYKGKDCNQCTQMVRPTINQMLKAIDLDSKLAGHYPVKQSVVANGQFTLPHPQPAEQEIKNIENDNKIQQNPSHAGGAVRTQLVLQPAGGLEHPQRAEQPGYQSQTSYAPLDVMERVGIEVSPKINKTQQISPASSSTWV